jgi:hypothetical protein
MCTTSCPAKCLSFVEKKLIGRVKVWKGVGADNGGIVKFKGGNGKVGIVAVGGSLQRNMPIVVIIRSAGFNNQEERK